MSVDTLKKKNIYETYNKNCVVNQIFDVKI